MKQSQHETAKVHVAALITSHNRVTMTARAVSALVKAAERSGVSVELYLVDDGSTDGTSAKVKQELDTACIVAGDGSLFWNGGMRLAWQTAIASECDYFLWLNDDLELMPDAIEELLKTYTIFKKLKGERVIIVGRCVDPVTGSASYGGLIRAPGLSKLRFVRAIGEEANCVTMNGNCVLLPRRVIKDIGINSPIYRHSFGDMDYGLRAKKAGYTIVQMSTPVAHQSYNHEAADKASRLSVSNWRFILLHPKGVPMREWLHFCRMHGGPLWFVNFGWRYVNLVLRGMRGRQS